MPMKAWSRQVLSTAVRFEQAELRPLHHTFQFGPGDAIERETTAGFIRKCRSLRFCGSVRSHEPVGSVEDVVGAPERLSEREHDADMAHTGIFDRRSIASRPAYPVGQRMCVDRINEIRDRINTWLRTEHEIDHTTVEFDIE